MENIKRIDDKTVEIDGEVYRVEEPCEEIAEKENKRFKPELGERYFYISNGVYSLPWQNDLTDSFFYSMGNCFKTKEEAGFAIEKLKVLAELKEFIEPKDAVYDGDKSHCHWYMYYNISSHKLQKGQCFSNKYDCALFESESDIENAIEAIGKDRIKKYIFGIDE